MYDNLKIKLHVFFFYFNLFLLHYIILQTDVKVLSTIFKHAKKTLLYTYIFIDTYILHVTLTVTAKFEEEKNTQNQLFVFQNFRKK